MYIYIYIYIAISGSSTCKKAGALADPEHPRGPQ